MLLGVEDYFQVVGLLFATLSCENAFSVIVIALAKKKSFIIYRQVILEHFVFIIVLKLMSKYNTNDSF